MKNNKYEIEFFTSIIKNSINLIDVCRNLQIGKTHGNRNTIKRYIKKYNLNIDHFYTPSNSMGRKPSIPLTDILVENSTYLHTTSLKKRLYKEGLKQRECEECGQNEIWKGKKLSLILDHINGVSDDNRIENLRILCPNCNATLDTHCKGAKGLIKKEIKIDGRTLGKERLYQRKVNRPSIDILKEEIKELGYSGTGRKYGVSDNAIRKWLK